MTTLSQAEWYRQLVATVPAWATEGEKMQAVFYAVAKMLAEVQTTANAHVDDTFITRATGTVLDTHGSERSVDRVENELDGSYRIRVQNLLNQSNVPALKILIDSVLVAGTSRIQEDFDSVPFLSRENFCNRAAVFLDEPVWNTFSVIVDKQTHAPFSYSDREYFCDREAFAGTDESLVRVFESLIQLVNDNKAFGTLYRVIELLE